MIKNNIFSNPIGWAEQAVGSRRHYVLSIGMGLLQMLLLDFLVLILHTWQEALALSVPIFILIAQMPLCYLRAIRALVLESRVVKDGGLQSDSLPFGRNDVPDWPKSPRLLKGNIFNNPIGWGERYVGSGPRYALALGYVLFQALAIVFLLVILTNPNFQEGVLLSIPILLIISGMHLCYLRALRTLVLERRAAKQEELQAGTSPSTS
jgi:hypothetical protein